MKTTNPMTDRVTAVLLIVHILAMFGGFMVLGPAFEFPDVLRYPAAERFAIFAEHQGIIQPAYWVLTMTGISQILLSVLLFHAAQAQQRAVGTLALIFGVLTGVFQALGFGRWVILMPYLIDQAASPEHVQAAAILEGAFNHYAGMLVGEHLANICWGIWLAAINLAFFSGTNLSGGLCKFGLTLSPLLLVLAGEQIGVSGDVLDPLVDFGFPLLAVWHILLAIMLIRRSGEEFFPQLGRKLVIGGALMTSMMVVPALV